MVYFKFDGALTLTMVDTGSITCAINLDLETTNLSLRNHNVRKTMKECISVNGRPLELLFNMSLPIQMFLSGN